MDKKTFSLLSTIVEASKDGEYVVFEKIDLIGALPQYQDGGIEELDSAIKYLELKKFIDIKISDSTNITLKPTSDAYIFVELEQKSKRKLPIISGAISAIPCRKMVQYLILSGIIGGVIAGVILIIFQIFIIK